MVDLWSGDAERHRNVVMHPSSQSSSRDESPPRAFSEHPSRPSTAPTRTDPPGMWPQPVYGMRKYHLISGKLVGADQQRDILSLLYFHPALHLVQARLLSQQCQDGRVMLKKRIYLDLRRMQGGVYRDLCRPYQNVFDLPLPLHII
jgi:hypothetical protein